MATQIYPVFKEDRFTWIIDEEESKLAIWGCYKCHYEATENESNERNCSKCRKKTELKLRDHDKEYWWCSTCNTTEIIKYYT